MGGYAEMSEYRPDSVTPPGDTLRELMTGEYGMTPRQFAARLRISTAELNGILSGVRPIDARIARILQAETGIPETFWIERERAYRAWKDGKR